MARQFNVARIAAGMAIAALAVTVNACGDSKPRVEKIPEHASSPSLTDAPAPATRVNATETPQPAFRGPVYFADGETAFHDRRYQEAVAIFSAYTEQKPGNVWGFYMLGLSEWKAGHPDRAVTAFERVLQGDSTHRKTLLNLSRVLLETGKPELGLAHAERVVRLDSGDAEGWRLKGRALGDLGRTDDGIAAYRRALVLDESDSWSMNNLGVIYLTAGRYAEALPPLARATELAPERAAFQNNLGLVLERVGQVTAASTAYRAALAADTTHGKAIVSLARVAGRTEATEVVPADLAAVARAFSDEIGRWREELAVVVKQ